MATIMTASSASGHITSVVHFEIGPFKGFCAHYSMPAANTAVFPLFMYGTAFRYMEGADNSSWATLTNSQVGIDVQVSGLVAGNTGNVFILGN